MDVSPIDLAVLCIAGVLAGYVNTVAGAGSLLTLPALIFTGLDASAANATNRISVLLQTATATVTLHRGGIRVGKLAWLCVPATVSAIAGAYVASQLDERAIRTAITLSIVVFLLLSFVPKAKNRRPTSMAADEGGDAAVGGDQKAGATPRGQRALMGMEMAAIGFYAGLLQVGVGVLVLLTLPRFHGVPLVQANALKVLMILVLTIAALGVFVQQEQVIDLWRGLVLGVSTAAGGYLGARATLRHGERLVRVLLVLAVVASVGKLTWDLWTD